MCSYIADGDNHKPELDFAPTNMIQTPVSHENQRPRQRTVEVLIPRSLRREIADHDPEVIKQDALSSFTGPLVILGEAGAGKTRLLKWLGGKTGYALCTARKLVTTPDPTRLFDDNQTLVIDALDELSTHHDGESVDVVLTQLGRANYPRFILSCRVADWRSALSKSSIEDHYGIRPTELYLLPFDDSEVLKFLSAQFSAIEATRIQKHLTARGLGALLGNPQTLQMVVDVAHSGDLPESRAELFDRAIALLAQEHRDEKAERQLALDDALDTAGAACAALLLTNCEAITRRAVHNEVDLPIAELDRIAKRDALNSVLDTRLFVAAGADRLTYLHRSIAEFLGARWLAKKCISGRRRNRLLQILQGYGAVPSALRGLHAWLAVDPGLTEQVIRADPMGFVEYGDPNSLFPEQAGHLLKALQGVAENNPAFLPQKDFRIRSFLHSALTPEVTRLIATKATPFGLRLLLLQALRDAMPDSPFVPELRRIVLDSNEWFSVRSAACEALIATTSNENWSQMIDQLGGTENGESIRLAVELMSRLGYTHFNDQQIVSVARAQARNEHRTAGVLFMLQRNLPTDRMDGVLNLLSQEIEPVDHLHDRKNDEISALTDFAYHLIVRRLKTGAVEAPQLWRWLRPYDGSHGYQTDSRTIVNDYLREHNEIRQAIQTIAILQEQASEVPRIAEYEVRSRVTGLAVSEPDAIALLCALDPSQPSNELWKSIVQLVHHDAIAGATVRAAALAFADGRADQLAWIDSLVHKDKLPWQIDQEARDARHRTARLQKLAQVKASYRPHINEMTAGGIHVLTVPAQTYSGLSHQFQNKEPVDRVTEMLGEELSAAALRGFEAALHQVTLFPTAADIANALADNSIPNASFVLAAGLAERLRRKMGFDDLEADCILRGFVAIYQTGLSSQQGFDGLDGAIATCAMARGVWKDGIRLRVEPLFGNLDKSVHELYDVMRNDNFRQQSTELAMEWLQRFPVMPYTAEAEIAGRLIASRKIAPLRSAWQDRSKHPDMNRRRLWLAVGLLLDFDHAADFLTSAMIEPDLLWELRARITNDREGSTAITLNPAQAGWIVSTFRGLWPRVSHPTGGWCGDKNSWDASRFLDQIITRLGNDLSEEAHNKLGVLRNASKDSYTEHIKVVMAEQQQALVESSYRPLTLNAIQAIVMDQAPASIKDLLAFMLDELKIVQTKAKGDDAESWRGFFNDSLEPHNEERCRDHLLGLLRQGDKNIHLAPETHVASDKEVDITCSVNNLRLPIEVKGQWHRDLWTAADKQLDALYATDWKAQNHGIYLVLWFGSLVPKNKRLNLLREPDTPATANELRNMLHDKSTAARQGRIAVFVLDLERTNS